MRKILYILFFISTSAVIFSCNNNVDFPYEGKDRVHFDHYTTDYNNSRTYFNTINHSLGLLNDTIEIDTARIVVKLMGKTSNIDRQYKININADSTSAIAGTHYVAFDYMQTMEAGAMTDTLEILIIRKELSSSYSNPEDKILYITLESSNDFDLGLAKGLSMKVILNNYLIEPKWWIENFQGSLNYYHPEKWKILIMFNEEFANYGNVPFRSGTQTGTLFKNQLEYYLNTTNPTFDKETGNRVYFDKLVPQQ